MGERLNSLQDSSRRNFAHFHANLVELGAFNTTAEGVITLSISTHALYFLKELYEFLTRCLGHSLIHLALPLVWPLACKIKQYLKMDKTFFIYSRTFSHKCKRYNFLTVRTN